MLGSVGEVAGSTGGEPSETCGSASGATALAASLPGSRPSAPAVVTPGVALDAGFHGGDVVRSRFARDGFIADHGLGGDQDVHVGRRLISWLLRGGVTAVRHRDPELRQHFGCHALDGVGKVAAGRCDTRGGDDTESTGSDEHRNTAAATAIQAREHRRVVDREVRPEAYDRFRLTGELSLGGRPSSGRQHLEQRLVRGRKRGIVVGVHELIDEYVGEAEGIVVDAGVVTAASHVALISESIAHIVTPRVD